jgi:hypothetical protein
MKLVLEQPFKSDWKSGYLIEHKCGRKYVCLVNKREGDRTTIAYARYLLGVKLGRYLTDKEEADHKDKNKNNDDINNLQVLTVLEHKEKTLSETKRAETVEFICPVCEKTFNRLKKNVKFMTAKEPKCSKKCAGLHNHRGLAQLVRTSGI